MSRTSKLTRIVALQSDEWVVHNVRNNGLEYEDLSPEQQCSTSISRALIGMTHLPPQEAPDVIRTDKNADKRHRSPARDPPAKRGKYHLPAQAEFDDHNRRASQNGQDQWQPSAEETAAFVTKLVKTYDLFQMGRGDGFHAGGEMHAWHVGSQEPRKQWTVQDWVEKLTQWNKVYNLYGGSLDGTATRGIASEIVQPAERAQSPHPGASPRSASPGCSSSA